jgi:hypothetical protein
MSTVLARLVERSRERLSSLEPLTPSRFAAGAGGFGPAGGRLTSDGGSAPDSRFTPGGGFASGGDHTAGRDHAAGGAYPAGNGYPAGRDPAAAGGAAADVLALPGAAAPGGEAAAASGNRAFPGPAPGGRARPSTVPVPRAAPGGHDGPGIPISGISRSLGPRSPDTEGAETQLTALDRGLGHDASPDGPGATRIAIPSGAAGPALTITIGHIEVAAAPAAASRPREQAPQRSRQPSRPLVSLSDFLDQRGNGRR